MLCQPSHLQATERLRLARGPSCTLRSPASGSRLHRQRCPRPHAHSDSRGHQQPADEDLIAASWEEDLQDWTEAPEQLDLLEEVWYEDNASPEALAQNAVAVVLSALLIWGFGSILWKLAIVAYALFAAAFRYSFVAFVLLVVVIYLAG